MSGKSQNHYAKYAAESDVVNSGDKFNVALCGGTGPTGSTSNNSTEQQVLRDFVRETLKDGSKNWPTSTEKASGNTNGPKPVQNDNAKAVAKDLVQELNHDEKTIVAGLLAKTIEGGEVVEIRAVSSTSVMVNACYDLLSEGLGVVPYACVGLGGNFVGVVDGHITIRPSLTLYAPSK
ncbi:surface antigen family protein [Anaplasma phagocytophilum str. CRT53-1]|uniref:Surface antigen family protein n=1 Tax=Anaplasma phagocytophilum str. CRT53-1 TaxID=1359157 RepID=A0A0F3PRZ7_ANAPH|nr:surface antigen family protein [Anaplasma phagocytophilum str. CRT53-1]